MKVVALIGNTSAPLVYFTNTIHKHHKIDLVIVQKPKNNSSSQNNKINKPNVSFLERALKNILFRIEMKKETALRKKEQLKTKNYYSDLFKADYEQFTSELKVMEVDDINSKEVEDAIKKIGPNLIIDHGTSLVKNHIIDLAELALNLHWGLSPYYRGVNCTSQALLNWDINNIGVTIHKLAKKIDGGDILGQARLKIEPNDTVATITSRLTFEGTAIVIKAIDKLAAGKTLTFKPQNFNHGFLIRGLYWDQIIHNYVNKIDENLMMKMIAKPSRDPAPIIELT